MYGVAYMALFLYSELYKVAMFRYYPRARADSTARRSPLETAGPPILWYSWLFGAAVVSLALALQSSRAAGPSGWAERWVCGIPAAVLLGILVYERRWFY